MRIVPLSVKDTEVFLKSQSRHYKSKAETVCAIGVGDESGLHGAAILGRSEEDAELRHIYCDGASEAYTTLYGACWRALKALGYVKAVL